MRAIFIIAVLAALAACSRIPMPGPTTATAESNKDCVATRTQQYVNTSQESSTQLSDAQETAVLLCNF